MAEQTNISWCTHTWSPWYGCTQVSMGAQGACVACYARQMSETRFGRVVFGGPGRGEGTRDVRADSAWKEPLKWEREAAASKRAWHAGPDGGMARPWPYSPFVFPSMCDPFDNHPALTEPRRRLFDLIRQTPHLTWLLLTKRPRNIVKLFDDTLPAIRDIREALLAEIWPHNAAIGCTVVSQEEADRDIPNLLAAKAALNPAFVFLSMEPLLGPVDLTRIAHRDSLGMRVTSDALTGSLWADWSGGLDWVITGGETNQGKHKARPSNPQWFRNIGAQCAAAGVPWHHKQNGEWASAPEIVDAKGSDFHRFDDGTWVQKVGKKRSGRHLDGVTHDAMPGLG